MNEQIGKHIYSGGMFSPEERWLVLDVENTVSHRDNKLHLDPFEEGNRLVLVGCKWMSSQQLVHSEIITFDHAEKKPSMTDVLQPLLDKTDVLVMHNASHDLMWLRECGFKYDGKIHDTLLVEYILQKGNKLPLSLEAVAERYDLSVKKQDTLKKHLSEGKSVRDVPYDELCEYLQADLDVTTELFKKQKEVISLPENASLCKTLELTNEMCDLLVKIHSRGFNIDRQKLAEVEQEFTAEKAKIEEELKGYVIQLVGDTPVNLNAPEQLSSIIYSRKPKDKAIWRNFFNDRMKPSEYRLEVSKNSDLQYKTKAVKCRECSGAGRKRMKLKSGKMGKAVRICKPCNGQGYNYNSTGQIAGLKFNAPNAGWISAHGWSTGKDKLEYLEGIAKNKGMKLAQEFLSKVRRLSALDTYLSSFVLGIKIFTKQDGLLHTRLVQHQTATGRLASREPNLQNMPRGGTFPIKKVFISRWNGGKILEADFAQLEFRTAAFLSQDKIAIKEIIEGFDVHSYTAKVISESGQNTTRQEAKAHTFAPLFGASGYGRTAPEATYYKKFTEKYQGIANWHKSLANEAVNTKRIVTPTGRQFAFPDVKRRMNGSVTEFTKIKNYPVQSLATADIVPVVLLLIERMMRGQQMKSVIVNTVHDSIVIDVHPDEIPQVIQLIKDAGQLIEGEIKNWWNIDMNVPMELDSKIGDNWLDTNEI